jgi:hypothetical protein
MLSTSDVLDRHLKPFAEYDLDRVPADYSLGAVLFTPTGPLKGPDAIRPLFRLLVSEFAKPGSLFTMQRYIEDDHALFSGPRKQQTLGTNSLPTHLWCGTGK